MEISLEQQAIVHKGKDMEFSISTDKSKLAIDVIHEFLCHRSYWAKGRSMESVKESIDNSLCFGLYDETEKLLGFARVITDKVAFAYIMDLFVLEEYRGKGFGKMLINHIINHPDLKVKMLLLGTVNAHGLYKKFGFSKLNNSDHYMAIKNENYY